MHLCPTAGYCLFLLVKKTNIFLAEADEGATAESSRFCVLIKKHTFLGIMRLGLLIIHIYIAMMSLRTVLNHIQVNMIH